MSLKKKELDQAGLDNSFQINAQPETNLLNAIIVLCDKPLKMLQMESQHK